MFTSSQIRNVQKSMELFLFLKQKYDTHRLRPCAVRPNFISRIYIGMIPPFEFSKIIRKYSLGFWDFVGLGFHGLKDA